MKTRMRRLDRRRVALMSCAVLACGFGVRAGAAVKVFVSIVPQEYFVERIGGERVEVQALVKPGHSPATYEPTPRQMAALGEAQVFFRIGVPFENVVVPKIHEVVPGLPIVDTRRGIELREMTVPHRHEHEDEHEEAHGHPEDAHEHGHGHGHGHGRPAHGHGEGGAKDPHVWLSPRLVTIQAGTIAETLIRLDPEGKEHYQRNYRALAADLGVLDVKLTKALARVAGKTFFVFHPAWGYFADAYGLRQVPVEIEGKEPSGQQLARVIAKAKAEGVSVIFVQPQFSKAAARTVAAAIDGAVVPIDPLARDYLKNLEAVAAELGRTLGRQKSPTPRAE